MSGTIKISSLPNAGVLTGTEQVAIVVGTTTKRTTTLEIAGLAMPIPYTIATPVTPGTPVSAGRGVGISCQVDGNIALELSGGSVWVIPVYVGLSVLDNFAVTGVRIAGTTAIATVTVLS